jgi:hypothetical protein
MPSPTHTDPTPNRGTSGGPLVDHTRWIASVVEIVAVAGAVVLAFLHSAT